MVIQMDKVKPVTTTPRKTGYLIQIENVALGYLGDIR